MQNKAPIITKKAYCFYLKKSNVYIKDSQKLTYKTFKIGG